MLTSQCEHNGSLERTKDRQVFSSVHFKYQQYQHTNIDSLQNQAAKTTKKKNISSPKQTTNKTKIKLNIKGL